MAIDHLTAEVISGILVIPRSMEPPSNLRRAISKASRPDGSFAVGYLGSNAIGQLNVSPTYSGSDVKGSGGVCSFAQTYKGSSIKGCGGHLGFKATYLEITSILRASIKQQ